jgi:hypothetical protein
MDPVQSCAGEELDVLAVDARVHAVAVELDFVQPTVARRRFVDEARQLRLYPFRRPIGTSHDADLNWCGKAGVRRFCFRLEWAG